MIVLILILCGYVTSFDKESNFKVEIRTVLKSFFIVWNKDLRKVDVEYDNIFLVELIWTGGGDNSNLMKLRLLHQMLHRKWKVKVYHISRDQNDVVDYMTKYVVIKNSLLQLFEAPSILMKELLFAYCHGPSSV